MFAIYLSQTIKLIERMMYVWGLGQNVTDKILKDKMSHGKNITRTKCHHRKYQCHRKKCHKDKMSHGQYVRRTKCHMKNTWQGLIE